MPLRVLHNGSPRRFAAMLASALITYVDPVLLQLMARTMVMSQTIAFGNETLEIVPKYLGFWFVEDETRRATKHVNHHFGAREEKWHNHYTVQVHGNDVSAIRKADKSTISFVHLGVTLNTILSIKEYRSWRAKLMREWFKLRPMEDMAPWNFILSSAGSLIYIDGQNFPYPCLNTNWIYTAVHLLKCTFTEKGFFEDPVSTYNGCMLRALISTEGA